MAEAATYDDILDKSFDELQDDKTLPPGRWILKLRNAAYVAPRSEGKSGQVLFFYTPVEPMADVDEDALAELGDEYDWTENQIVFRVWIEGNRSWRDVQRHLKRHAGVDFDAGTIREVLKVGVKGAEITARLEERTYENALGELLTENDPKDFQPIDD